MLKRIVTSSALLIFQSLAVRLVGMMSTLILARALMPEDFGVVAMALLVVAFIEVFGRTGAQQYALRAKEADRDLLQSVWTLNLLFRLGLAMTTVVLAPLFAKYFNERALISLLHAFAALLVVGGLSNTPGKVLLQRDQCFKPIIKLSITAKVISAIFAVTIALLFHSYWALVVGKGISTLVEVIGSYYIHSARPAFNIRKIREIFGFSFWVILQSLFGYFRVQFDTLLVTTYFGNAQLGSFHTMKYLAFIPHAEILLPATTPLIRAQAKNRDLPKYFAFQHNVSFLVGAMIALNFSAVMTLSNQQLVAVLLGANWMAFKELFFWFCILITALFLFQHATRICLIYGKSRTTFIYELFAVAVVFVPLISVGIDDISKFTSLRVCLEVVASFGFVMYTTIRFTGLTNLAQLAWLMVPILLAGSAAGLAATILTNVANPMAFLIVFCSLYATVFVSVMAVLLFAHWHKQPEWKYLMEKGLRALQIAQEQVRRRLK